MTFIIVLIFSVSILEIAFMCKKGQTREMIIFILFSLVTLIFGYYYYSNPHMESFSQRILSIIGQEF